MNETIVRPEMLPLIEAHAARVAREEAEIIAAGGVVDDDARWGGGSKASALGTRAKRSEAGLCIRCGKGPPLPGWRQCQSCRNYKRDSKRRLAKRKRS